MKLSETLSVILDLLLLSGLSYHLFSLFCVRGFFSREKKAASPPVRVPVSILKPLKGVDPEFKENLKSFCRQEYPHYEVLLGFSKPADGEIAAVRKKLVPLGVNVRVVTSDNDLGANNKVSNLQGLVEAARYPLLAISDSDMRVEPFYLREIVAEYYGDPDIGLVTNLYKISDPRSIGAAFESLTIALDFLPSVLVAQRLEGVTFGLGASMLLSKKGLDDIGGLPAIADYLADDYQIGSRLSKKGYTIVLSRVVLENIVGPMSIRDYLTHQIRWARTYRASRPRGFAGYGITHIFPFSLLLLMLQGPTIPALSLFGLVALVRCSLSAMVYKKVISSRRWLKWLPLLPLKDLLSFGIWCWSFASSTVTWRGRSYKIIKEGKIREEVRRNPKRKVF